jgi:multidrug efflux pump subunit AcrA (membrane-fusion protein)
MITAGEFESPASAPSPTPCPCNQGRVMLAPNVWCPCSRCNGTGDRAKHPDFRAGWNAALAESQVEAGALRNEIEALRGLLAEQRIELTESQADLDRMAAYDQRQQQVISEYAAELAAARAQGERSMRDAVLRWHQEQWIKHRVRSGTNAIAGAHMFAHQESIAEISALAARELPGGHHPYVPHPKYPWFCRDCGYPEHERLKHEQSIAAISALNVDKGEQ